MKKISKVTVTGADDSVSPDVLIALAKEFPFVEFGLLVSDNKAGPARRFPSRAWFLEFQDAIAAAHLKRPIQISGHICGQWVNDCFLGAFPGNLPAPLVSLAQRWQLNTHGNPTACDADAFLAMIADLNRRGQEVIFQYDGQNTEAATMAVAKGLKVSALFDQSHGAGILPGYWPPIDDANGGLLACPWGFAGGLSPENVAYHIDRMPVHNEGPAIWIDAETHLRSDDDRTFDLYKVRAFLKAAQPWVIK